MHYLAYLCCFYLIVTTGGNVTVCVCVCGKRWTRLIQCTHTTHAHTYRHACGWLVCFVPAMLLRGAGTLFDLESIIVHLSNLACVWTNCVGLICRKWILLIMHFCVHLKTAELKKQTKNSNVKSIYSCLCITGESCVQMYFVYTMLYITEVHSFLVQYCT